MWWPCSTAHLKEPGTAVTACGEAHPRWKVFWELDFSDGSLPRCVDCVAVATRTLDLGKVQGPERLREKLA